MVPVFLHVLQEKDASEAVFGVYVICTAMVPGILISACPITSGQNKAQPRGRATDNNEHTSEEKDKKIKSTIKVVN